VRYSRSSLASERMPEDSQVSLCRTSDTVLVDSTMSRFIFMFFLVFFISVRIRVLSGEGPGASVGDENVAIRY
jgi:hypothetical protein